MSETNRTMYDSGSMLINPAWINEIKGNQYYENGYTKIDNDLLSAITSTRFPGAIAVQSLLVIIRKTYGWGKESDRISMSQFMKQMGFNDKRSIRRSMKKLEEMHVIDVVRDRYDSPPIYSIQKKYWLWEEHNPSGAADRKQYSINDSDMGKITGGACATDDRYATDDINARSGVQMSPTKETSTKETSTKETSTKETSTKETSTKKTSTKENPKTLSSPASSSSKKKKEVKTYADNSIEFSVVEHAVSKILKNHPALKFDNKKKQKYCDVINKLIRIDKRTVDEIIAAIDWVTSQTVKTGNFCWADQFQSPIKLRKKNSDEHMYIDVWLSKSLEKKKGYDYSDYNIENADN